MLLLTGIGTRYLVPNRVLITVLAKGVEMSEMSEMSGGEVEAGVSEPSSVSVDAETVTTAGNPPGRGVWAVALIVSAALAVLAINFSPTPFKLPAKYETADLSMPGPAQEEAARAFMLKEWKNSLLAYTIAGLALGFPAVVVVRGCGAGRSIGLISASLVFGAFCGVMAASLGSIISEKMLSAGYDFESMVPDITVWIVMSMVLALPAAMSLVVGGERLLSQKVIAIPMGGLLTGVVVTIGVSLFLPSANTSKIPPTGIVLTVVWFAVLVCMILLLSTFTGARNRQPTVS